MWLSQHSQNICSKKCLYIYLLYLQLPNNKVKFPAAEDSLLLLLESISITPKQRLTDSKEDICTLLLRLRRFENCNQNFKNFYLTAATKNNCKHKRVISRHCSV